MAINISNDVLNLKQETINTRRHIHKYPELGFQETKTSELIFNQLTDLGYEVKRIAKTGITALVKGHDESKTIAIRADIDCLPLQELSNTDYKSQHEGKMHACGHDGHTAIALSLAKILKAKEKDLKYNVKLIFQPAEEGPGGAEPMIKEGALENPKVDAIFGLHLWNTMPIGKVGIKSGPMMASADEFTVIIKGKGGHGAQPHLTVDAVIVSAYVITALQTIISRNTNPLEPAVLTVGKIEGGSNFNIIAESVKFIGTVRTFNNSLRNEIEEKIKQVIANTCSAFGADYEINYNKLYPPTINNQNICEIVNNAASEVIGSENIIKDEVSMGAEDMSYFLEKVPGCYFFLGSANKEKGFDKPHHNPYFDFDEDALSIGTEILLRSIFKYSEKF